jgi:hypothetical protein
MMGSINRCRLVGVALAAIALAGPAAAQVLDGFASPQPGWTRAVTGLRGETSAAQRVCDTGVATMGGLRDTMHEILVNPHNSLSAIAVGGGRLAVAQGAGTQSETLIGYGAFTRYECGAGGKLMAQNLAHAKSLVFSFTGVEDALSLHVVYYTSAPRNPEQPQYYAVTGINGITVPAHGGVFETRVPMNDDPGFNWERVDGIAVIINRSGGPQNSFTLRKMEFSVN